VNTAKSEIDVTIKLSIKNTKPPDALYDYYYTTTGVEVEVQAGPVKATSNAGKVKQSLVTTARTTAR